MKRSGDEAGRPMGKWSIEQLEKHVTANPQADDELLLVQAELGYRKTHRALILKDLTKRLIDEENRKCIGQIGPLFSGLD